jgi:hypothetical protein
MDIKGLFAYSQTSQGAKELAKALGVNRIKHIGSAFVGNKGKILINWGSTNPPKYVSDCTLLNPPDKVAVAVDKALSLNQFKLFDVPSPDFTGSLRDAQRWLEEGHTVFARTLTRASSGRGIVVMMPDHPDTWDVRAQLYTKYIKKRHEYRIHVVRGRVIDTQRKGLRQEFEGREDINHLVRNLANGFVFVRNDGHVVPQVVKDVGVAAVNALNLDFGAADVIYNERANRAYAIEVNAAPGLQGTTIESYAEALRGNHV